MPVIFINDEQHQIITKEDFENLVNKYMGDDANKYLCDNYFHTTDTEDLREMFIEDTYLESSENDMKFDEAVELLEKCWSYLRANYEHNSEIGEEIREFIDEAGNDE